MLCPNTNLREREIKPAYVTSVGEVHIVVTDWSLISKNKSQWLERSRQ